MSRAELPKLCFFKFLLVTLLEDYLRHLVRDLQLQKISRAVELAALEGLVNIYFDEPEKQTKIWSIERQLEPAHAIYFEVIKTHLCMYMIKIFKIYIVFIV